MKITLKLVRPAKSKGGDRYEAEVEGEDKPFVVYFPQSISRFTSTGNPLEEIIMEIKK